jgi:sulfur carrier protein ThiS
MATPAAATDAAAGAPTIQRMKITFKLYASLTVYLPESARRDNQLPLELAPGSTVGQVIEPLGMPPKLVHLVLVNGKYIAPEQRLSATLSEGDVLAIWPPIAGG